MEKIILLDHILTEAKVKGACKVPFTLYEKAMQSKDYDTASQIVLGYRYWLRSKGIIHITLKDLQDILSVSTGLRYYDNEQIETKETYKNGQLHGEYLEFYETGQIRIQTNYKDGYLNGEYIECSQDGTVKRKKNYEMGHLHQINIILS